MASLHLSKSEELYEKVNISSFVCELGDKARLAAANKKAASLPEQLKQTMTVNRKIYNSTMIGERIIANLLAKRLASV